MLPLRLLLVEDHNPTRVVLSWLLRKKGYDVTTAASAGEAKIRARSRGFDLVLSDIGLPDSSGLDLMADLQKEHPGLKGIALTALGTEGDRNQSSAAGFSRHLTKPVSFPELERAIHEVGAAIA